LRRTSLLVLGAAVVVGGWLRLSGLGKYEMTADEAATWIAASAPTVRQVVAIAGEVNPGKLALHDVTLHAWILAFGDSIGSMRTLSAILGTIAIGLVYLVGVELFQSGDLPDADAAEIAAIGALVFALCPAAVSLSREARMYPVMLDVALAQVWVLIRAARSGGAAS
jgi:4-amino-4-deoxy-L-arabinose transferase-like glycosyltransferase